MILRFLNVLFLQEIIRAWQCFFCPHQLIKINTAEAIDKMNFILQL
jgi:hypothetical protein